MTVGDFDPGAIRPIRWGKVTRRPGGDWTTVWTIQLERASQPHALELTASHLGRSELFAIASVDHSVVTLEVVSALDAMELHVMAATYELFLSLESSLGRIKSIQGTPRDWWQPFREP